jgi:hypothetical protein
VYDCAWSTARPAAVPRCRNSRACRLLRSTRAKMETNKENEWNPFIQDVKKGALR